MKSMNSYAAKGSGASCDSRVAFQGRTIAWVVHSVMESLTEFRETRCSDLPAGRRIWRLHHCDLVMINWGANVIGRRRSLMKHCRYDWTKGEECVSVCIHKFIGKKLVITMRNKTWAKRLNCVNCSLLGAYAYHPKNMNQLDHRPQVRWKTHV